MINVYKNQQNRQTGSTNQMGPKTLLTIWGTYMKLVTKYQISAINSCWEKCDEKCAYMFNVYTNQLSRQTGSRNLLRPKGFPRYGVSIWRLWPNIRSLSSIVAEKKVTTNMHICSMCIKINKVGKQEVGIRLVQKRFPRYEVPIWSLWPNIRFLPSIVAEKNVMKNVHICSMCIKNQLSRQTGSRNLMGPKTLLTIWGTYMTLETKYQISVINGCWEKGDEKCSYMFNVYTDQLSRQTGSRNLTGPKTLPTIWYTYMMLVTKYQISAVNSYWGKCDDKYLGRTKDGRTDGLKDGSTEGRKDGRTEVKQYTPSPFGERGYNKCYIFRQCAYFVYISH